jgi:hypothetical protein
MVPHIIIYTCGKLVSGTYVLFNGYDRARYFNCTEIMKCYVTDISLSFFLSKVSTYLRCWYLITEINADPCGSGYGSGSATLATCDHRNERG